MAINLRLADPERQALDRIRIRRHAGTATDVLRQLIREADPEGEHQRQQSMDVGQTFGPQDRAAVEDLTTLVAQIAERFGIEPDDPRPPHWANDPQIAGAALAAHIERGPRT